MPDHHQEVTVHGQEVTMQEVTVRHQKVTMQQVTVHHQEVTAHCHQGWQCGNVLATQAITCAVGALMHRA